MRNDPISYGDQLYKELVVHLRAAGLNAFERIEKAHKLLGIREWVQDETRGGGDESRALDRLEAACFGDLAGYLSLPDLLDLYRNVPNVKDWEKARFNLRQIWLDWRARSRPDPVPMSKAKTGKAPKGLIAPAEFDTLSPVRQVQEYTRAVTLVEHHSEQVEELKIKVSNYANRVQQLELARDILNKALDKTRKEVKLLRLLVKRQKVVA